MNWGGMYLRRLLSRNLGRSLVSFLLASLLAFAFGLMTVLQNTYKELYQNVEVKADFTGGLSYQRALKIAGSGYVHDPYYEYVVQNSMVEMEDATIILTNRLDKLVSEPIEWLDGWDAEQAMNTSEKVMVMYSSHVAKLSFQLGDYVRVNETDWWPHVSAMGMQPLEPGETSMDRRDKLRPFFQIVGIIQSDSENWTAFIPAEAYMRLAFLIPKFNLDLAEYTLSDYHQITAFNDYAKGELDKEKGEVDFSLDNSEADRIYEMYHLLETLYPLTIAAALLLGSILPGLTVLHASKEICILRALGVKVWKCVNLYTLAQVLCALAGLLVGMALVLIIQRPELNVMSKPFSIYLAAHIVACAIGSGVFAWLCARKHVLAQLQSKE